MGGGGPSLPSFPRKRESRTVLPYDATYLASHRRIPAYAGMTVKGVGKDSRAGGRKRNGAADGIRTHDPLLGKEMLYH